MMAARLIEATAALQTREHRREVATFFRAHPVETGTRALKLALERFDAIGQFRDQVDGDPIDASATLPDGTQLDGEAALRALLVDNPAFPRTMLRKLFVYGVGREATASERLALDLAVDQKAALGVVTIADLLAILVATPAFTHREVLR